MAKKKLKYYMGNDLSLNKWLEFMRTKPKDVRFEDYMFPSNKITDKFIKNVHKYDEDTITLILRHFLAFGPPLGADIWTLKFLSERLKQDKKKTLEDIKQSPHLRRLTVYAQSRGRIPVYDSILWILDLLPDSPREALNVIDAFGHIHLAHLPDGKIHGLFDAEKIIRARYFDAKTDTSVLYSLNPPEFEHVAEALYYEMGYKTQMTKASHDGGRDIIATQNTPGKKERNVISCKRTKDTVELIAVREVFAPLADEKATKATVITTSDFSKDAYSLAERNPRLELINQKTLQRMLNEYIGTTWSAHLDFYIKESEKRHPKEKRV